MGNIYKCKYNAPEVNELEQIFLNVYYMATSSRDSNGNINYTYLSELAKANGLVDEYFILLSTITTEGEIIQRQEAKKT